MDEIKAINDAYNIGVQCLFNMLFEGHIATTSLEIIANDKAAEVEADVIKRFRSGIVLLRKTHKVAVEQLMELSNAIA